MELSVQCTRTIHGTWNLKMAMMAERYIPTLLIFIHLHSPQIGIADFGLKSQTPQTGTVDFRLKSRTPQIGIVDFGALILDSAL